MRRGIGLLLILIGNVLLLDRLPGRRLPDSLPHMIGSWWPLLLLGLAVVLALTQVEMRQTWLGPLAIGLLGLVLLTVTADPIRHAVGPYLLPVGLILVGWWIASHPGRRDREFGGEATYPSEWIVLDSRKIRSRAQGLRQGKINVIFGSLRLDLRDVAVTSESPAGLSVNVIFGGMEVLVGPGQRVRMTEPRSMLGRCRGRKTRFGGEDPELQIRPLVVLGGFEIREKPDLVTSGDGADASPRGAGAT